MRKFARPQLEGLEDRDMLTTYAVDLGGNVGSEATTAGKIILSTTINLLVRAEDGTVYQRAFPVAAGEDAVAVRDRVVVALTAAGWNVTNAGQYGFQLTGHGAVNNSPANHLNAYTPALKPEYQPVVAVVLPPPEHDEVFISGL